MTKLPKSNYNELIRRFVKQNKAVEGSTVFQGDLYEYTVMRELNDKLWMKNLEKRGGAHDGGIDILGKWPVHEIYYSWLKHHGKIEVSYPHDDEFMKTNTGIRFKRYINTIKKSTNGLNPLKVMVQCKALKNKLGPKEFRELVGTFTSQVKSQQKNRCIAIMCSPNLLTKDILTLMNTIDIPIIYLRIEVLQKLAYGEYNLSGSGLLRNYYTNFYCSKLLHGCNVKEWLDSGLYETDGPL